MKHSKHAETPSDTERDQYQHYLPRFILKPFAEDMIVNIYSLLKNSHSTASLNTAFGDLNFYRSKKLGDDIEKRLMKLEGLTSQAFSYIKKAAVGSSDVQFLDRDIDTIKRFFAVSALRTRTFRDLVVRNTSLAHATSDEQTEAKRELWLEMLRYLLPEPSENRTEFTNQDPSSPRNEMVTNAIRVYNTIESMQMHIWKSPPNQEFLLGDPLVQIESVDKTTDSNNPRCAHLFLPISPTIVVVLCDRARCTPIRSMISRVTHAYPQLHILPGRKKPGQKGYRGPKESWVYPITSCDASHLLLLNQLAIRSTRVVYRDATTFQKAASSIISFKQRLDKHNMGLGNRYTRMVLGEKNSLKERLKLIQVCGFQLIQIMKAAGAPTELTSMMYGLVSLSYEEGCLDCRDEILEEIGLKVF